MKSSMRKIIAVCTVCAVMAVALIFAGLWGYFHDDNRKLDDYTRIEKVLANTGRKIEENNKNLAASYNKSVSEKQEESETNTASVFANDEYTYTSGKEAFYKAIEQINNYSEWYVYFEYFSEFLGKSFLEVTYDLNYSAAGSVYVVCILDNEFIELAVTASDENGKVTKKMIADLYFNEETLEPRLLDFFDTYTDKRGETQVCVYTNHIIFDFIHSTFEWFQISTRTDEDLTKLKKKSDAEILQAISDQSYYFVDFNDYSKFEGESVSPKGYDKFLSDVNLTPEIKTQVLDCVHNFLFPKYEEFFEKFDFENVKDFEKGDEAMQFAQKYRIVENKVSDDEIYLTVG